MEEPSASLGRGDRAECPLLTPKAEIGVVNRNGRLRVLEDRSPNRLGFDRSRVMRTPYRIDDLQQVYFVVPAIESLVAAAGPIGSPRATWRLAERRSLAVQATDCPSRFIVVFLLGLDRLGSAQGVIAARSQPLESSCLGEKDPSKTALHLPLRDDLREPRQDQRPGRQAEIRMRPGFVNPVRDDPTPQRRRGSHSELAARRIRLVQDRLELQAIHRLLGDQSLQGVETTRA